MRLSLRRAEGELKFGFRELIRRLSWLLPTRELGLLRIFCLTCLSLSGKRMLRLLAIIAVWGWVRRRAGTWGAVSANFLPFVFESFRQADATITRNYSGLGLGLAIVRQLVELHGGTVWAQSPGLDMGSTFSFRLPSMQVNSMVGEEAQVLAGAGNLLGVKVLLVDDEVDSREFMRFVLADSGAAVRAASSAAEAFEVAQQFGPDVLVSDIGMPEEDGYSLLRRLRSLNAESGKFGAIALTAYARDEDRDRAFAAGFDRHLPKPVQPDVLVDTIVKLRQQALTT